MSDCEPPSTKEVLLNHLYSIIEETEPEYVPQITGMLAECQETELMQLLGNKLMLMQRVGVAVEFIKKSMQNVKNSEGIGEELFQKVASLDPYNAAQITGMLLELDQSALGVLITDQESLSNAVVQARGEILVGSEDEKHVCCLKDELGEKLYCAVGSIYPNNAAKITGMLWELGPEKLTVLLDPSSNSCLFNEAVEKCRNTLDDFNMWIKE